MNQTIGFIAGIFVSVCGLAIMIYAFIKTDINRKECNTCNKQGDEARFCSIEKGGCNK